MGATKEYLLNLYERYEYDDKLIKEMEMQEQEYYFANQTLDRYGININGKDLVGTREQILEFVTETLNNQ